MITITSFGTYGPGEYRLGGTIAVSSTDALTFTGTASLDLSGHEIRTIQSGNPWDHGVQMQGGGSLLYDSKAGPGITGFRVGVKLTGANSRIVGVDLSGNRYMGAWLSAAGCHVIGGRIGEIGGVTDEKYAIGVQCDRGSPLVEGVRFDEMYSQPGVSGVGEGLPVNFSATSSGGIMRGCICVNQRAERNTYGVFGGSGGGHQVLDCLFYNFWRGVSVHEAGGPVVERNAVWLREKSSGSIGISCEGGQVADNAVLGPYDTPIIGASDGSVIAFYDAPAAAPPPPPPPPPPGEFETILSKVLDTAFGNISTKTLRVDIGGLSSPTIVPAQIRLKLRGHADEPLALSSLYLGHRTSGPNMANAVRMRVGNAGSFVVPQGGEIWTDWAPFIWDGASNLLASLHCSSGASSDKTAAKTGEPGSTWYKYGDEASQANVSGFAEVSGYLSLISEIEIGG